MNKRRIGILLVVVGLVLTYMLGLGLRRMVLEAQYVQHGEIVPFTLESALHFRRIREIVETGGLRPIDEKVQYPDGVDVWRTYSVGSEFVYAGLARLLPSRIPLGERLRWIESAWFCLGIPLMGLWVGWLSRSRLGGAVAAAFYAVCLSSVVRSTGQELSRENFALPLLIGHLALEALAGRTANRKGFWTAAAGSGFLLGLALCSWDLVQFYVFLWLVYGFTRLLAGRLTLDGDAGRLWCLQLAGLTLAAWLHPYSRAHGVPLSPMMLGGYGVLAAMLWDRVRFRQGRATSEMRTDIRAQVRRWILVGLPVLAGFFLLDGFGGHYGHFTELLLAKLQFLNQKPADPALLTFNQRMMWVPALHSADFYLTFAYFPAILLLSFAGSVLMPALLGRRTDAGLFQLLFFSTASLVTFILFVRFHVFLVVFLSAMAGFTVALAWRQGGWVRWVLAASVAAGLVIEAGRVIRSRDAWGRQGVYYRELDELTRWLRDHAGKEPVLANFGASASVLTYADCPVLLHPKFEAAAIRERVEEYSEALYKGDETGFRDWADREGAVYYVHGIGAFAKRSPEYQMRYMADAMTPPPEAPVRQFEAGDRNLEFFRWQWENRKYRVYRMKTRADEHAAAERSRRAEEAFQRGDLDTAEREAMASLTLDPMNEIAVNIIAHVTTLRDQGFSYRAP